jgi:VWFA-related protein
MTRRHPRSAAFFAALAALSALVPGGAFAQEVTEPFGESVDVEVVDVDVVVTDSDGLPVVGLNKEDFVVYEDGQPREITNFYSFESATKAFERHRAGDRVALPSDTRDQVRRIAILFDVNSLTNRERKNAVEAVEQFMSEKFDGSYEWSIVAFDDQVRVLQPFTSDKYRVKASLDDVKELRMQQRRRVESSTSLFSEDAATIRNFQRVRQVDQRGGSGLTLQDFEGREKILEALQLANKTARAAVYTMRAHARMSGRKSLILVTGAMESLPTMSQLLGSSMPLGGQQQDRADPALFELQQKLVQTLGAVVQTANAAGFSIFPMTATMAMAPVAPHHDAAVGRAPFLDSFGQTSSPADPESAPRLLADGTGGRFFQTSRYYEAFHEIDSRTSNTYVLGFQTVRAPDRKYHKLRVEVKPKNLKVSAREGYLHLTPSDRIMEELSTPLVFPKERGEIPVQVSVAKTPDQEKKSEQLLTVMAKLPVRDITLVPQGEDAFGRVQLFLGVYNEEGNMIDLVPVQQDIKVESAQQSAVVERNESATFKLKVRLKPGSYTLSLTAMDQVSSRFGTALERVQI